MKYGIGIFQKIREYCPKSNDYTTLLYKCTVQCTLYRLQCSSVSMHFASHYVLIYIREIDIRMVLNLRGHKYTFYLKLPNWRAQAPWSLCVDAHAHNTTLLMVTKY